MTMQLINSLMYRYEDLRFSIGYPGYPVMCRNLMKIFKFCGTEQSRYEYLDWIYFIFNENVVEFLEVNKIKYRCGIYKKTRNDIQSFTFSNHDIEFILDEFFIFFARKTDAVMFIMFFENCEYSKMTKVEKVENVMIFDTVKLYKDDKMAFVANYKKLHRNSIFS